MPNVQTHIILHRPYFKLRIPFILYYTHTDTFMMVFFYIDFVEALFDISIFAIEIEIKLTHINIYVSFKLWLFVSLVLLFFQFQS